MSVSLSHCLFVAILPLERRGAGLLWGITEPDVVSIVMMDMTTHATTDVYHLTSSRNIRRGLASSLTTASKSPSLVSGHSHLVTDTAQTTVQLDNILVLL